MRAMLLELREKITGFRGSAEAALFTLRTGLPQRSDAAAAGEVLKIDDKIDRLHEMPPGNNIAKSLVFFKNFSILVSLQKTIESLTTDSYYVFFVMPVHNLPFIENMEKRIQRASALLDTSLGHCFIDGLNDSDIIIFYNCICAYAAVDNTTNAEEIFHTTIVAPFIRKINAHETSVDVPGPSGDELENDYKQIKHFIAKDCKSLLEISSTGISLTISLCLYLLQISNHLLKLHFSLAKKFSC